VTYSTPGPKTVTLTVTKDGCTSTTSQTINVAPLPTISFVVSPASGCPPLAVTITQSSPNLPGYTYIWDYGNGVQDTSYTPTSPIIYNNTSTTSSQTYTIRLIVITDKGCKDSLQYTITVHPQVLANFTAPALVCEGVPVTFTNTSSGANSYQWNFGDGSPTSTATSPTYAYPTPGTYTVQLIAINTTAGCRDTFQQSINVNPIPNPTFTPAPAGGCVPLTVNLTNTTPFDPMIVTSTDGCKDTITKSVPVNAAPNPNFGFTTVCLGQATSFTDLTSGTPTGWEWDFGDGSLHSTLQNPTHTYAAPGTYSVKLIVRVGTGCVDSITKSVTVYPVLTVGFTATTACAVDEAVSFTNTSSGATAYQWNFGDGSPISTAPNPTHVCASGGTYAVQLITSNGPGCRDTFTQNVLVYPKPTITFSHDTVCLGGRTSFTASSNVPIGSYSWNFGDGSPTASGSAVTHTYGAAGVYTVTLIGQTADGCRDTFQKSVWVKPLPTAAFTANTPCFGEPVVFTDNSTGAVAWQWNFGDGVGTSTASNPTYTYSAPGTYPVTLTVFNNVGCSHTITQNVTVRPKP